MNAECFEFHQSEAANTYVPPLLSDLILKIYSKLRGGTAPENNAAREIYITRREISFIAIELVARTNSAGTGTVCTCVACTSTGKQVGAGVMCLLMVEKMVEALATLRPS